MTSPDRKQMFSTHLLSMVNSFSVFSPKPVGEKGKKGVKYIRNRRTRVATAQRGSRKLSTGWMPQWLQKNRNQYPDMSIFAPSQNKSGFANRIAARLLSGELGHPTPDGKLRINLEAGPNPSKFYTMGIDPGAGPDGIAVIAPVFVDDVHIGNQTIGRMGLIKKLTASIEAMSIGGRKFEPDYVIDFPGDEVLSSKPAN